MTIVHCPFPWCLLLCYSKPQSGLNPSFPYYTHAPRQMNVETKYPLHMLGFISNSWSLTSNRSFYFAQHSFCMFLDHSVYTFPRSLFLHCQVLNSFSADNLCFLFFFRNITIQKGNCRIPPLHKYPPINISTIYSPISNNFFCVSKANTSFPVDYILFQSLKWTPSFSSISPTTLVFSLYWILSIKNMHALISPI